jgi:hypothetical protein
MIKICIEWGGLKRTDCFSLDFPKPCDPHPVMTLIIWTAKAEIKRQSEKARKCKHSSISNAILVRRVEKM